MALGQAAEAKVNRALTSLYIEGSSRVVRRSKRREWKRISLKKSTRCQYLSQLKTSDFFSLQKNLTVKKCNNLYLGLATPSSGCLSPIGSVSQIRVLNMRKHLLLRLNRV